ncbi:phosphatidylinositol-binding clathrin assembly protein-like isoform X1 [Leptonychotes weddellii]|uniref:Phosphatidylinositol-binding clathrin assembly protein-like isoform X1 n=1 Tax=Leptonychotes weddellii TaxID=9713 RepID=A0A7F8R522_LEPWE|nr:phosphatidylinositol-binding clathrin assembly protein-like isoform X1 [Leptonychotes weddellii]
MGSSASKAAHRATTDEPTEPEAKHLADLIQYINGTNMSVEHLADILSEKTGSSSWVVVFKALVTVHHLMVHGNERFIQHLASRNSLFTLHNFLDKSVMEGYAMSTFIRRYSRYLNEKSLAYRLIASDITKTKRGMDGMMRTMDTKQLLNTLPVIQTQFDALLNFNANPDELTNGIIHAAFMLLFKDSLRLFAAYNEGILNLLDKYFDMRKNECKESLDIYIKFLERTPKLVQFLKVAEQVGIDQNNIPYLTQAPHSLLEALKQHLASLEENNDSLLPYSLQHALIPSIPNNPVMKASASRAWFAAHKPVGARQQCGKTIANNLDGSLASLVGNLNLGESPVNKFVILQNGLIYKSHLRSDMKWPQPSEMEIPGGMKWQLNTYTCTSTLWKHISIPPVPHMVLPPVGYPVTSQQVPMYRTVQTPMGAPSLMAPQPMIHTQPGLSTSNSCSIHKKKHTIHVEVPKEKDSDSEVNKGDDLSTA